MKIIELMGEHYKGLLLTPGIYHSLDLGIHIELGEDIYQINEDGKLNMKRFHTVYRQVAEIFPLLFKKKDDVIVVVNSYPSETNKIVYPNFFQRYVKVQQRKYSLRMHEFIWQFDEDDVFVQQMELFCKVSDLKLEYLLKTLIHEDFGSLNPRLRKKYCIYAPDIFFVNVRTKCIFHIYDDRGCEIMNTDVKLHKELVEYFKEWEIQVKV
ncbi:hypothetical protein CSE16_10100 [Solibacillus sp. R5-41]|uniref:DUF3885 domain-containing protein n=1 Tax=Solibacillus sp. R5-41 TaxID=2048654 RepID=UPI000C1260A4|nr:DUF3885 domain-containing protein [Solibacillus sp. R5-41]ATP40370.1 hypothetical protein CSE16_10100 [Solibacillus sp. R5-41]